MAMDGRPGVRVIALAVVVRDGRVLVGRRPPGSHLSGLWEFPGGGVEPGESPEEAAARELKEETGVSAGPVEPLATVTHDYPGRRVRLLAYVARHSDGEPSRGSTWRWVCPEELKALPMPEANGPILRVLEKL